MKLVIDEDVVRKTSTPSGATLTFAEVLACLLTKMSKNGHDVIDNLVDRGILIHRNDIFNDNIKPFSKYQDLVSRILVLSDNSVPTKDELTQLATQLKEIYPKGRKSPSVPWQESLSATIYRLQSLYKNFPEIKNYSHEQILEATANYISLFKDDNTYMRTLNYFLWKKDETLKSSLLTMLENPDVTATTFYDSVELM